MDRPSVVRIGALAWLGLLTLPACSDTSQTEPCPSENGDLPAPVVMADGQQVQASLSVHEFCTGGHGDGPLILGEPPVALAATDEVVVEVRSPFVVKLSWSGEPFVTHADGSYVSPGAAPGCHRLDLEVRDPASPAVAWFGVNIATQSAC